MTSMSVEPADSNRPLFYIYLQVLTMHDLSAQINLIKLIKINGSAIKHLRFESVYA